MNKETASHNSRERINSEKTDFFRFAWFLLLLQPYWDQLGPGPTNTEWTFYHKRYEDDINPGVRLDAEGFPTFPASSLLTPHVFTLPALRRLYLGSSLPLVHYLRAPQLRTLEIDSRPTKQQRISLEELLASSTQLVRLHVQCREVFVTRTLEATGFLQEQQVTFPHLEHVSISFRSQAVRSLIGCAPAIRHLVLGSDSLTRYLWLSDLPLPALEVLVLCTMDILDTKLPAPLFLDFLNKVCARRLVLDDKLWR